MQSCYAGNTSNNQLVCWDAQLAAEQNYYRGLAGSFQPFHVNSNSTDPSTETFFSNGDVLERIGAVSEYTENNIFVSYGWATTGAFIRNSRPILEGLINKGILVGMWSGDAVCALRPRVPLRLAHPNRFYVQDFIGNYMVTEILVSFPSPPSRFTSD